MPNAPRGCMSCSAFTVPIAANLLVCPVCDAVQSIKD